MEYTIIRSERKTAVLRVGDGLVEVRAPMNMPESAIDRFVTSKEDWINERLERLKEQRRMRDEFTVDYGGTLTYRGKDYPITERDGDLAEFDGESFCIPPNLSADQVKAACVQIYLALAKQHLTERTLEYAEKTPVSPAGIKINKSRARWGSCCAKKIINLSWYLIMADDDVSDYVIVHELAHLIEMNHSKQFWAVVESILPDYKERRKKLKELHNRLNGENWE